MRAAAQLTFVGKSALESVLHNGFTTECGRHIAAWRFALFVSEEVLHGGQKSVESSELS
jgi:hypothetical protein